MSEAHDFLLAGSGDAIKELHIGVDLVEGTSSAKIADDFRKFLPNVSSLSLRFSADAEFWLEIFGGQIDTLVLWTEYVEELGAISFYCTMLRSLKIQGHVIAKRIDTPICNGSANTLEYLEIWEFWELSVGQIENLRKNFRKLKRITINGNDSEAVTDLLVSYGNQLEYASLTDTLVPWKEADLLKITSACKTARFEWRSLGKEIIDGLNTFWSSAGITQIQKLL